MESFRAIAVLCFVVLPLASPAQTGPAGSPQASPASAPGAGRGASSSSATSQPGAQVPRGAPLTADAIMARVAANQDRSNALRSEYIYHQHIHILLEKASGKRMREETSDYLVTPTPDGVKKNLTLIQGHYRQKGRYLAFEGKPVPDTDSVDGGLAQDMRDDLMDDKSKDGLGSDLFPLTTEQQKKYRFRLLGQEEVRGRPAYHITFGPKDRSDIDWAGEAFIDAADFQPVRVFTRLSRPIPFLIRKFLVNLPGVGFDVEYSRQPDGVWFPVSFGTEFRIRVLMVWARDIIISMSNSGFERAHVQHRIQFEGIAPAVSGKRGPPDSPTRPSPHS